MQKKYFYILTAVLIVIFSGCGPTSEKEQNPSASQQNDQTLQNSTDDASKSIYTCNSTQNSENSFSDFYTSGNHSDTEWSASSYDMLSNHDIERAFNTARQNDSTVHTPMVLPPQEIWNNYTSSEKVLYLVNHERCDRGLRPYEGIDISIENVAMTYADYLKEHPDSYDTAPHEADGRNPWQRMEQDAGVQINVNADFFQYGENIASIAVGSSGNASPLVYEPEAKSVYGWMYEDKNEGYGHRNFILAKGLIENSGFDQTEGLIGVGVATRTYKKENIFWTQKIIVMDGFDPKSSWDNNLTHTRRIVLYR